MSNYIESTNSYKKGVFKISAQNSVSRLVGLSNLSRYLLGSNTLKELMSRSARSIIEILNMDFVRIITYELTGHYCCRITSNKDSSGLGHGYDTYEPYEAETVYDSIRATIPALTPVLLDEVIGPTDRAQLNLPAYNNLWIMSLIVNTQPIGFLILGKKQVSDNDNKLIATTQLVDLIGGQLSNAIYRIRLNDRLSGTSLEMVKALTKTLEARDSESGLHSQHMAGLSQQLALKLNLSENEAQEIYWGALLHDIGKIGIEDRILHKPGPLTDEEWTIMKSHCEIGARIVQGLTGLDNVAPLILAHHERIDGSGYPKGLKGDQIPLGARIIAVVDSYNAMVEGRVYRSSRTHAEAMSELSRVSGVLLDEKVVKAFKAMINHTA